MLDACANENDIANLGGEIESVTDTKTVQSESNNIIKTVPEDFFIDKAVYDHLSPVEYQKHFLDDRIPVENVKKKYQDDVNYLIAHKKNAFTFDNCEIVPFPDVNEVQAVVFKENNLTCDEAFDIIRFWLDKWGLSDRVNLDKEVRDTKTFVENSESGLSPYPLAKDVWDKNDGSAFELFRRDLCYIHMFGSGAGILSHGVIADYVGMKKGIAKEDLSYTIDPYDFFGEVIKSGSLDELKDSAYMLLDGSEITIGEAQKAFEDFYSFTEGLDYEVYAVDVIKVEDRYVYKYKTRRVYKGVPIASDRLGHVVEHVKSFVMSGDQGSIYVASPKEICAFYGNAGRPVITELCNPQTEIVGIKDAMDIVYGLMSKDYRCNIDRIAFSMGCYRQTDIEKDWINYLPPCWEFFGHSDVSGKDIRIYVDVLTGETAFKEYYENVIPEE